LIFFFCCLPSRSFIRWLIFFYLLFHWCHSQIKEDADDDLMQDGLPPPAGMSSDGGAGGNSSSYRDNGNALDSPLVRD